MKGARLRVGVQEKIPAIPVVEQFRHMVAATIGRAWFYRANAGSLGVCKGSFSHFSKELGWQDVGVNATVRRHLLSILVFPMPTVDQSREINRQPNI